MELTKEQYDQILKELREIKQIIAATKKDIRKIEEGSREIRENMAIKGETAKNKDDREIKDIVENIGDMTDSICDRIDSMCHKMNDVLFDAYGMPTFSWRRCRNLWRPFYCGEDGINSTRCSSTGYRY